MQFNFFNSMVLPFGKGELFPFFPSTDLLLIILVWPFITFVYFLLNTIIKANYQYIYALISSGISFVLSIILLGAFNYSKGGFQETFHFGLVSSSVFSFALRIGVDGISVFFIVLTNRFIFLCIQSLNLTTFRLNEVLLYLFFLQ